MIRTHTIAEPADGANALTSSTGPLGGGIAPSDDCHSVSDRVSGSTWRVAGDDAMVYPGGGD